MSCQHIAALVHIFNACVSPTRTDQWNAEYAAIVRSVSGAKS